MATHEIKATLPGVFYRKPSPDANNFKEVGDSVDTGEVIGLIEVMKSFHEVTCDAQGSLAEFCVENEEAITPGQVVAKLST